MGPATPMIRQPCIGVSSLPLAVLEFQAKDGGDNGLLARAIGGTEDMLRPRLTLTAILLIRTGDEASDRLRQDMRKMKGLGTW